MHGRKLILTLLFFLFVSIGAEVAYAQALPRDGYIGVVSKSDKRKPGQQFTFANLRTQRPFITFPSGNGEETMKVFEDDETNVKDSFNISAKPSGFGQQSTTYTKEQER